jgi:hypothetical protein
LAAGAHASHEAKQTTRTKLASRGEDARQARGRLVEDGDELVEVEHAVPI